MLEAFKWIEPKTSLCEKGLIERSHETSYLRLFRLDVKH